ncbi:MAG TPA: hypothetical protein VIJ38_10990, partial [Acidobacteriaceae bacterium]
MCGSSARTDLYGGQLAIAVPTVTTRIASYRVEAWSRGQWREVFAGESPREMVYRTKPTSAERVRL